MSQDETRARGGVSPRNLLDGSAAAGTAAAPAAPAAAGSQLVRRPEIVPGAPPPKVADGDLALTVVDGRIVHDEGIVG